MVRGSTSLGVLKIGSISFPKFWFTTWCATWKPSLLIFLKLLKQFVSIASSWFLGKDLSFVCLTSPPASAFKDFKYKAWAFFSSSVAPSPGPGISVSCVHGPRNLFIIFFSPSKRPVSAT